MPNAETARLIASLELKDQFTPGVNKALGSIGRLEGGISRAEKAGQQVGTGLKRGAVIAAGAVGLLATQVNAGLQSLIALESATAQTNAVLTSTKGIAGQTAESIRRLSEKYEGLNATMDDKVIQSGANVLLTFTNIRKQAFEPALEAALNLSTAMGTDLQGSIVQVGKALSDPIKGITALTRVGVTFTQKQKDQIKALVESGKTLEAQKVILAELNKEFGGSFLAGGGTTAGKVAKFNDSIEDLQKTLATALLPTIGKVADGLTKFLADPAVIKGASDLGKSIASLFNDKNLATGGAFLKDAFQTAKSAAPIVAAAAKTTFAMVQSAVGLFKSLPPGLQTILVSGFAINKLTGGLVTNLAGGLIGSVLKQLVSGVVNVRGASVIVTGGAGVGGAAGAGAAGAGFLGKAASAAGKIFGVAALAEIANVASPAVQDFGVAINRAIFGSASGKPGLFGIDLKPSDLQWPFGPKNTPTILADVFGGNGILGGNAAAPARTPLGPPTPAGFGNVQGPPTPFGFGASSRTKDDRVDLAQLIRGTNAQLNDGFRQMVAGLKNAKSDTAIAAALKTAISTVLTGGKGNVANTQLTLDGLKSALKNTNDPKLQRALRDAIGKVQAKLPAREFAARQLAKLDGMLRDGKLSTTELRNIKGIEKSLRDRGLPHAADVISKRVDAAKAAQVRASKSAGQQAAFAIRDKDLSVTTNVSVPIAVTMRSIINGLQVVSSYGHTAVARGATRTIS